MGASDFMVRSNGSTAREAFQAAVEDAEYEYGHGGYSGTIAEKDSFKEIPVPKDVDPVEFANSLMDDDDDRINDKWGPAGCVKIEDGKYLFFGWASS